MSNILNTRVWAKVIISPGVLMLMGMYLSQYLYMPMLYMYVVLGLIYALGAQLLEMKYFNGHNVNFITGLDTVMAFLLIVVANLSLGSKGVHVTLAGVLIYTFIQGALEHVLHISARPRKKKWQRSTKTKKARRAIKP